VIATAAIALAATALLGWWSHGRTPAPADLAADTTSATATPRVSSLSLRTLIRDSGELSMQGSRLGQRVVTADPDQAAIPWRPGQPFAPACKVIELSGAGSSIPFRALEFSVAATGLYYIGADFETLPGPANLWPRFLYSPSFDVRDPAGQSCRGGGAILYARLSAGIRYTLVTAGWSMQGEDIKAATGNYADIIRRWAPPRADIDGDAISELLWQDDGLNRLRIEFVGASQSPIDVGFAPGEVLVATGDLDADGTQDLMWHNQADGRTSYTPGRALLARTESRVDLLIDQAWHPTALGDFDGDGRSDIVWTNSATGETHMWLLAAGPRGATSGVRRTVLTHPTWRVVATGDLDGDFRTDLIWSDPVTGESAYWLMDGLERSAEGTLLRSAEWRVVGTGDLNADGRSDLLWFNEGARDNVVWLMDDSGLSPKSQVPLLADTDWRLIGSADVDGDGRADLLWRNSSTNDAAIWRMAGPHVLERREVARPGNARPQPG
jgi:hypothetical protein